MIVDRPSEGDVERAFASLSEISIAPWTDEEVESLNEFQASGIMHPFTHCDGPENEAISLVATNNGWTCPIHGPTDQDWAHKEMADGSWKIAKEWLDSRRDGHSS